MSSDRKTPSPSIPVLNMGELGLGHDSEPSEEEWKRVGKEIVDAFEDFGFVYLDSHGVPENQTARLVNAGATFFDLPQEVKNKFKRDPAKQQGYVEPNREKFEGNHSLELREAYDVKLLNDFFPEDEVPDFKPSCVPFLDSCMQLTERILVAIALGLDLDRNFFLDNHQEILSTNNASCLRLLHYPSVPEGISAGATRCGVHTDYGTITLLFQDDMGGLYVKERGGNWISADPIPGTILVNVGDLLQFWTSGKLRATEHRVLIPPEEIRRRKCRRSTVFFIHADDPTLIDPIDGSIPSKPLTAKEHVDRRFSQTYQY